MVELQHAGFALGDTEIVSDATFAVRPGSLALLYGLPGSGKTSILRLMRGEIAPSAGRVLLFGEPVPMTGGEARARLRRRIGSLDAAPRFLGHLSVRDNVAVPLLAAGIDPAARADDLADLLDWVGLGRRAGDPPATLGPAERRRAALARAVIGGADLLLADEPSRGLGGEEAIALLTLLVELNGMGQTIILATGEEDVVEYLGTRTEVSLLHLSGGQLAEAA